MVVVMGIGVARLGGRVSCGREIGFFHWRSDVLFALAGRLVGRLSRCGRWSMRVVVLHVILEKCRFSGGALVVCWLCRRVFVLAIIPVRAELANGAGQNVFDRK